jgi:hypothetical protein
MKKPTCDYENYDGVAYEEDKAMHRKMEYNNATCLNHKVGVCMKSLVDTKTNTTCGGFPNDCGLCFKFDKYVPVDV